MNLEELYIKGFKCFKDSGKVPIHSLTVFIGENDFGKSSIVDAIDILLNNKNVNPDEYHFDTSDDIVCDLIEIVGIFGIKEEEEAVKDLLLDGKLELIKRLSQEHGIQYFIKKVAYTDDRLNSLDRQVVQELKDILIKFGLEPTGLKADLIQQIRTYLDANPQPTTVKELSIQWKDISELVPIFQRYSSSDYGDPHNLVAKVLSNIYRTYFYETNEVSGEEKLKNSFNELKTEIETNLDTKIQDSLKDVIKKYNPNVNEVRGRYNIDFAKGLNFFQLEIDTGSGLKPIGNRGEGAKKRLYLAILEWDKEIENELPTTRGIIKAYDEPDSNLHFGAQRKLFYTIQNESEQKDHVQNIVCTHALTMIDRAPALSINCLIQNEFEQSVINYLETDDDDDDIREFLGQVSEIGGIRNSSIFYERCFLLVEGPSEENAIPILYKKYSGRNLSEDGVVLINLESNGAWKNFLKLLKKNKEDCTLLFLDNDTQNPTSTASITPDKLDEIGFSANFLSDNVVLVGTKEFEDIYPDNFLVDMLNLKFPRDDGNDWSVAEIQQLKRDSPKFSEDLRVLVSKEHKKRVGKPEIALEFANFLPVEEVPNLAKIKVLFDKVDTMIK